MAWTGSYDVGDVVQYHRGSVKLGIPAKSYATVETVDREQNLLTVRTTDRTLQYRPTHLRGVEVFRSEQWEFAVGERMQFRAPVKAQQIANGALGRIETIDQETGRVKREGLSGDNPTFTVAKGPTLPALPQLPLYALRCLLSSFPRHWVCRQSGHLMAISIRAPPVFCPR
jgi:hypothetical protein